jgi:antagonist of KipI
MLTTIQDIGRWGWQAEGVSVSGPMDPWSLRAANALVGNDATCAALEVTLVGPELRFDRKCRIAVTGAEYEVTVDDAVVPMGRPFVVPEGARLRFGKRLRGGRAYVAFEGGIDVPPVLGSRATHLRSRMGGLEGRALVAGDRLTVGLRPQVNADRSTWTGRAYDAHEPRLQSDNSASTHARVRVLPGPQQDRFSADALEVLQSGPYKVTPASDRMGFRLEGPRLRHDRPADIISDPTSVGSLQVPGEGQPLLLMAERQTTGGYAKLATVIAADIGLAGQLLPGDTVSFEVCSMREAILAVIARERALMMVGG